MSANIIGTFALVDFPEFGVAKAAAKIDTGAYTGALHCSSIEEHDAVDGGKILYFVPFGSERVIRKETFVVKYVRSSNGKREKRYFIVTQIGIQNRHYEITLSLANRSEMRWPVLIGRRFLRQHQFLVDPSLGTAYIKQPDEEEDE